jgi:hypothetical protein
MTQRKRRLAFLVDELNPLWVVERCAIQRQEVTRFLCRHRLHISPKDLIAITPSLTVVDSFFAGAQTRIGLSPRQFIRETDFAGLRPFEAAVSQCAEDHAEHGSENTEAQGEGNFRRLDRKVDTGP